MNSPQCQLQNHSYLTVEETGSVINYFFRSFSFLNVRNKKKAPSTAF